MKKVSIVSERNEENNTYEIRTLVIFDENKAPVIIDYEGAQDLVSVVKFAEENGFDILGKEGIKPALDAKLVEIISKSNEKKMSELKAEILQEQLKFAPKEEKTEEVKNIETVEEKKEANLPVDLEELKEYLLLDKKRIRKELNEKELKRIEEL